jgi:hypothetical protein
VRGLIHRRTGALGLSEQSVVDARRPRLHHPSQHRDSSLC